MKERVTFSGTYDEVVKMGAEYAAQGYYVVNCSKKRYLIFWQRHTVTMERQPTIEVRVDVSKALNFLSVLDFGYSPSTPTDLHSQLQDAIDHEEYERAAMLRDKIKGQQTT
jgi:hypothetical protein